MKKRFGKELVIGASVIVALVILFVGIDYLKGINLFKPANFYVASYSNVAGLEVSAPVSIDGYKVGQVREINFDYDHPGKIEVVMALDKKLRVPEDSKAEIGVGLLNGAYINLKLGKSAKMADVGSQIEGTLQPDMMSTLSDELLPSVSAIIPQVDSLLRSVSMLASDPALVQSVKNLEVLTDNAAEASRHLNKLMARDVTGLMGDARKVAVNLDSITADLGILSGQLKQLPLDKTMGNIEALTANLSDFSNSLNDKNSTLGLLTSDPELYNRLNRVTADIDSLIVDIKKNPKRYISIKLL